VNKDENMNEENIFVSFDVFSLHTKIPITGVIETIKELTDKNTTKLVEVCLRSTCFIFRGDFYEQVEGMEMDSIVSPMVANLYMEKI
jgi:hypothetical protein